MKLASRIGSVIIMAISTHIAWSETAPSVKTFGYPVEKIYIINNPDLPNGFSYGSTYKEACIKLGDGFFWGVVPSTSELPKCYTTPGNNIMLGAETWFCSDGSISYFNSPAYFCPDFFTCPDSTWTLSADKLTCSRKELPCVPDPENVSEEQLLAAIAYGESHWSNDYEEMAGIASATLRYMRANAYKTVHELILKGRNFSYATAKKMKNERYFNLMCNIKSPGVDMAYQAARNALDGGYDYSNGGCFWDGVDLKVYGENAYRYQRGFKISDDRHNVHSVSEPPPRRKKGNNGKYYSYIYESTAGANKTIFWKLSDEFLAAGGKQCH